MGIPATTLRIEPELLARAEALAAHLNGKSALARSTRSTALRAALIVGLAQLEREHGLAPTKATKARASKASK